MSIVKVIIEEHLVKTIEIECPDGMSKEERMEYAEEKVIKDYKDGKIVLTADDYSGATLYEVEDKDTDSATEWVEV